MFNKYPFGYLWYPNMYYICKKKQMESLHDYFFLNNRRKIKDSDIQVVLNNKDFYSEIAEAFERVCYGHAYVLNHFDDTFLYTSLHAPIWCRNSMDECRRAICKEENKLVEEVSLNLSHVFERLMREEKTHAVIYSSFHIDYQNCPLMVNCLPDDSSGGKWRWCFGRIFNSFLFTGGAGRCKYANLSANP